jgi:hypothetical protein
MSQAHHSAAGVIYSWLAYDSPSSKDVTEVEYALNGIPGRPSLSPATKKRYRYQLEADMSEMSSISESEIHAVMEEQARKKRKTSVISWNTAAIRKVIWNDISVADPI